MRMKSSELNYPSLPPEGLIFPKMKKILDLPCPQRFGNHFSKFETLQSLPRKNL